MSACECVHIHWDFAAFVNYVLLHANLNVQICILLASVADSNACWPRTSLL